MHRLAARTDNRRLLTCPHLEPVWPVRAFSALALIEAEHPARGLIEWHGEAARACQQRQRQRPKRRVGDSSMLGDRLRFALAALVACCFPRLHLGAIAREESVLSLHEGAHGLAMCR